MKQYIRFFSTALSKMMISFIGIVCLTTLLIGGVCGWVFNQNYRKEIEKIYAMTYQNVYRSIETDIIAKAMDLYLNIGTKVGADLQRYERTSLDQSFSALYLLQKYLQEYAAVYSDIISEISVYSEKDDLLLSSLSGLIYFQNNPLAAKNKQGFLEQYHIKSRSICWLEEQINSYNTVSFLTMSAPVLASGLKRDGNILINISISQKALANLLANANTDTIHFYLSSWGGRSISTLTPAEESMLQAVPSETSRVGMSFFSYADNIILYQGLPDIGCSLFSVASVDSFYQNAKVLQTIVFAACAVTILLSTLLSGIIAKKLYRPVRRIISSSIESTSQLSLPLPSGKDEYDYIDIVLNSLTFRISHLQQTLSSNQQLILYSVLMKLLTDSLLQESFIRERLELLSMSLDKPHFYVALIQMPAFSQNLPVDKYEYLGYKVIQTVSQNRGPVTCRFALKMIDETIAVIINSCHADTGSIADDFQAIHQQLLDALAIDVRILISKPGESLSGVYGQYHALLAFRQEFFVLPQRPVLTEDFLCGRVLIQLNCHDAFYQALQERNLGELHGILQQVGEACRSGTVSYQQVNQVLMDILNMFALYSKAFNIKLDQDLYREFTSCDTIDSFNRWLLALMKESFCAIENKSTLKTSGVIREITGYIADHLDEGINLNTLADQFHLSPNYLSKLFREQNGMGFPDYISSCRLERAVFYLLQTDLTIDSIAQKVGFAHSTYFIKKFREKYGVTPVHYRNLYQHQRDCE